MTRIEPKHALFAAACLTVFTGANSVGKLLAGSLSTLAKPR